MRLPEDKDEALAQARARPSGQRALSLAFGATTLAAATLAVTLIVLLVRVQSELDAIREDSASVQEGLALSLLVREHLQHEAGTVVAGGSGEMRMHRTWLRDLTRRSDELAARLPPEHRPRVARLQQLSGELDRGFTEMLAPAAARRDREALVAAYSAAQALTTAATEEADAIVHALEARMDGAQTRAHRLSRMAVWSGSLGLLVALFIAAFATYKLRGGFLTPLAQLGSAAEGFGERGEMRPLDPVGYREFAQVAAAFNEMTTTIQRRESEALSATRWATIGQLTAGIAHELNNPIAVISGYLKTIVPTLPDGELRDELLIIDEEARVCGRIVADLLLYASAPNVKPEPVDARALILTAVERAQRDAQSDVAVDVGEVDASQVNADPVRIRQVVVNLVHNAIEASDTGGVVEVAGVRVGDRYVLEVRDRGAGFPVSADDDAEDGPRDVFQPFVSGRPGGTGLGLAITQAIVHAHGGQIEALPREGGGTTLRASFALLVSEENS